MNQLSSKLIAPLALLLLQTPELLAQTRYRLQSRVIYSQMAAQLQTYAPSDSAVFSYSDPASTSVSEISYYSGISGAPQLWTGAVTRFTYNASGDTALIDYRRLDTATGVYVRSEGQQSYTYNASGTRTAVTRSQWSFNTGQLENESRETYTINAASRIEELTGEYWLEGAAVWQTQGRQRRTYNSSGHLLSYISETKNQSTGAWIPYDSVVYRYDINGTTQRFINQYFYEAASSRYRPAYEIEVLKADAAGQPIDVRTSAYDRIASVFVPNSERHFSYTTAGLPDSVSEFILTAAGARNGGVSHIYDRTGPGGNLAAERTYNISPANVFTFTGRTVYHYEAAGPLFISAYAAPGQLSVYPVPAVNELQIAVPADQSGAFRLSIIDMQGRQLRSLQANSTHGQARLRIDLDGLPTGNYQLRMTDAAGRESGTKFSVLR